MRATLVTVVTTVCLLIAGLPAPASAIPPPDQLSQGPDIALPRLVYGKPPSIETRGVSIPLPSEVADAGGLFGWVDLLGRTPEGWVVSVRTADDDDREGDVHESLHLVTDDGSSTTLFERDGQLGGHSSFRLSTSHTRVIRWRFGDGPTELTVFDLAGRVVAHRRTVSDTRVLAFTGTRAIYAPTNTAGTWSWTLGHTPRRLTKAVPEFVDVRHDVLAVDRGRPDRTSASRGMDVEVGSLAHPLRVRWHARFRPVDISPDGRRLVGSTKVRGGNALQVRRTRDGKVLRTWRVDVAAQVRWAGNTAVAFTVNYAEGDEALVRCALASSCVRVGSRQPSFQLVGGWTRMGSA